MRVLRCWARWLGMVMSIGVGQWARCGLNAAVWVRRLLLATSERRAWLREGRKCVFEREEAAEEERSVGGKPRGWLLGAEVEDGARRCKERRAMVGLPG